MVFFTLRLGINHYLSMEQFPAPIGHENIRIRFGFQRLNFNFISNLNNNKNSCSKTVNCSILLLKKWMPNTIPLKSNFLIIMLSKINFDQ